MKKVGMYRKNGILGFNSIHSFSINWGSWVTSPEEKEALQHCRRPDVPFQ